MPLSGRKPKPPKLKVIEGNPGKRAIPKAPEPVALAPDEPDWAQFFPGKDATTKKLRADARAWWRDKVPVLDGLGLLSTLDDSVLVDAAICWARLIQIERVLTREGLVRPGHKGPVRHPLATVANAYRSQLRFHVAVLGLSPSDRGRMPATQTAREDADDLLD